MSALKELKFIPKGFAECLQSFNGQVQAEAERIAGTASSYITGKGTGFHVELTTKTRFLDPSFGVDRPVAYVVPNDDATSAEEAEHKILSKAVGR